MPIYGDGNLRARYLGDLRELIKKLDDLEDDYEIVLDSYLNANYILTSELDVSCPRRTVNITLTSTPDRKDRALRIKTLGDLRKLVSRLDSYDEDYEIRLDSRTYINYRLTDDIDVSYSSKIVAITLECKDFINY